MPVFNEAATVLASIDRLLAHDFVREVVVVDDGSHDGTFAVLAEVSDDRVRTFRHDVNMGKGAALRTGFQHVLGPYVTIQDADLEYDPSDLPRLLGPLVAGAADVVYGSRFLSGDARRVLFFWHSLGNRMLTLLSNAATNLNLSDMETCYKVFRKEVLDSLTVEESRFGFEPEVTVKVAAAGWRIYEVGISYEGRTYEEGKKIGWRDGVTAIRCIGQYSLRERARSRRKRALHSLSDGSHLRQSVEALEGADNYYAWIADLMVPHLRGHVLDIGAGSGTVTRKVADAGFSITAVEPDEHSFERLESQLGDREGVSVFRGTSHDLPLGSTSTFDSAILVNVLEHIEDDKLELQNIKRLLAPGSPILLWVPANELLYSRYDLEVGHYRRYTKRSAESVCRAAGLEDVSASYVNAPGALAWALVAKTARLRPTSGGLSDLYDSRVIPAVRSLEGRVQMPFGQSLLVRAVTPS
jgi:2-polyprenyl-3-methyl-5-hydroxy-6-metoxy-1,4-benzoquinol methylase